MNKKRCECGRELEDGEKRCPRCRSKRKFKGQNIVKGLSALAVLVLIIVRK
jgi:DNA-directed RNA polymerase subunit RPC12/RpoP